VLPHISDTASVSASSAMSDATSICISQADNVLVRVRDLLGDRTWMDAGKDGCPSSGHCNAGNDTVEGCLGSAERVGVRYHLAACDVVEAGAEGSTFTCETARIAVRRSNSAGPQIDGMGI
jgi:hypothetical protein